jgi:hypothetical protein
MHTGDGVTSFDAADGVPRRSALQPKRMHAQPLADALGVVVGVD